jgi:hypothetical protein
MRGAAEADNPLQISGTTQVAPFPSSPSVCSLPAVHFPSALLVCSFASVLSHLSFRICPFASVLSHLFFWSVAVLAGAGSRAPGIGLRLSLSAGFGLDSRLQAAVPTVSWVTLVTIRLEGSLSQYRGAALSEIMVCRTHLRWKF